MVDFANSNKECSVERVNNRLKGFMEPQPKVLLDVVCWFYSKLTAS
jgi:hypothetical protein